MPLLLAVIVGACIAVVLFVIFDWIETDVRKGFDEIEQRKADHPEDYLG